MRRFAFTPPWLAWHVLMVTAVVSCLWLGDWQWVRALDTGSLQNFAYAVQWPFFAVFFAGMWWRMMRLESRKLDEQEAARAAEQPAAEQPAAEQVAAADPVAPAAPATEEKPGKAPEGLAEPSVPAPAPRRTDEAEDPEDAQLAAYNRMLAALAAHDEAESARR